MNSFEKYEGQIFDNRYKITKVIGVGGMAVVFEAFDTKLNRIVAVKMLKDEIANDSQAVKRFINESKAVSMLSHPNIVSIYDVSVKDNLKYIVMERVDGITLKSYMKKKGALPFDEIMNYSEQILRALEHAHSKGIIHRDIKPQNIMLLKNGRIKVTDFGIAKLPNAETVTMTDKAIGTVFYISPEQASGKAIDQRSDLYSLGVLMYEMATGKLPFNADSPVSVALMQVSSTATPPREIKPDIAVGLEQIIELAMRKQPNSRFQNASQMLHYVMQLKNNPEYVFKSKKNDGKVSIDDVNNKKRKTTKKGGKSMFPVILGVTAALLVVVAVCAGLVFMKYQKTMGPSGAQSVSVPNIVGQVYTEDMQNRLKRDGFKLIISYDDSDPSIPSNTILSQRPDAGTQRNVIPGQQLCDINIVVSRGNDAIEIKDWTLKEYTEVEFELEKLGLTYAEDYEQSDTIPSGHVIRTMPMAGDKVYPGSKVTIYISNGGSQQTSEVQVPNFVGLSEEQAKTQAAEYGLSVGNIAYEKSQKAVGTVISQSINAYDSVAPGTAINFTVSN